MDDSIDIRGLDKAELLIALYNRAKCNPMDPDAHTEAPEITKIEAQKMLDIWPKGKTLHVINGKTVKLAFLGDTLAPANYNYYNGPQAAQMVVSDLRSMQQERESPKDAMWKTRVKNNSEPDAILNKGQRR